MIEKSNMVILIMEPHDEMRRIVRGLLRQLGFQRLEETISRTEAMERLHATKINLVIADWSQQASGIALIHEMRRGHQNPLAGIPVILMSTRSGPEHEAAMLRSGAEQYIIKPFPKDVLKGKMKMVLGPFD